MKIRREYSIIFLILSGIALLIFGVNFLKGLDLFQKPNVYHVVYGNVAGINGASPVFFHGYKVGQVIGTKLLHDGKGRIVVTFQLNEDRLALPKDSRVQIYSSDLFSRSLQLHVGRSQEMAQAGDTLIGDVELSLTDALGENIDPLKAKAEGMFATVDSVLTAFQQILNQQTVGDIDSSFTNIRRALESLSKAADKIDHLVDTESASFSNTIRNMEKVSRTLANNSDEMDHIFSNLDTLTAELARGRMRKVMDEMAIASTQLREMTTSVNNGEGTMGRMLKDDSLYNNLNDASRELDMLLEDLRINPNRYFSVFGKKDRLPKLSDSDIERIGKAAQKRP